MILRYFMLIINLSLFSSKDWLRKYRPPKDNIPRGIVLKLENKEQLSTGDRHLFLEAIYHDVTKYIGGMQVNGFTK